MYCLIKRSIVASVILIAPTLSQAIINGTDVNSSDPLAYSVIALQTKNVAPDGTIFYSNGSAVVIGRNLILTAGHMFYYVKDNTAASVILSVAPSWDPNGTIGEKRVYIKNAEMNPNFRMDNYGTYNDIAVAVLSENLPEPYHPLKMADKNMPAPVIGSKALVSGYGVDINSDNAPVTDRRLRMTHLPLMSIDATYFSASPKLWFDESVSGIRSGDSGCPAIFDINGIPTVFGVAIHHKYDSQGQALPESAFTNVVFYRDWLDQAERKLTGH